MRTKTMAQTLRHADGSARRACPVHADCASPRGRVCPASPEIQRAHANSKQQLACTTSCFSRPNTVVHLPTIQRWGPFLNLGFVSTRLARTATSFSRTSRATRGAGTRRTLRWFCKDLLNVGCHISSAQRHGCLAQPLLSC